MSERLTAGTRDEVQANMLGPTQARSLHMAELWLQGPITPWDERWIARGVTARRVTQQQIEWASSTQSNVATRRPQSTDVWIVTCDRTQMRIFANSRDDAIWHARALGVGNLAATATQSEYRRVRTERVREASTVSVPSNPDAEFDAIVERTRQSSRLFLLPQAEQPAAPEKQPTREPSKIDLNATRTILIED